MSVAIESSKLLRVILDYMGVLYQNTVPLLNSLEGTAEFCHILRDLRQHLKQALEHSEKNKFDLEFNQILRSLFSCLENIHRKIVEKANGQNEVELNRLHIESLPMYQHLGEINTQIHQFLKRLGILAPKKPLGPSQWFRRISPESIGQSLWPLVFLPDRNMSFKNRPDLLRKIQDMLHPQGKPQHLCVVSKNGLGGMGKTELVLECAHRSVEEGVFGVVIWIACQTDASIVSSFRYLARRIVQNDPSFLRRGEDPSFSAMSSRQVIDRVINWIERLPMPYLIIMSDVIETEFLSPKMFPQSGQGTIVLLSLAIRITPLKGVLKSRPKVVELCHLTPAEGMAMCEDALVTSGDARKTDMLDLMSHFDNLPSHIASALICIQALRDRSFSEVGPREFLNQLSGAKSHALVGHNVDGDSGGVLRNAVLSSELLTAQLALAREMLENIAGATLQRMLELLCFISGNGVDLRVLFDWIRPSYMPLTRLSRKSNVDGDKGNPDISPTRMTLSVTFPEASISRDTPILIDKDFEFIIVAKSMLPRLLSINGEYSTRWQVHRTLREVAEFFSCIQTLCSRKIHQISFPQFPKKCFIKQVVSKLNDTLSLLCADISWPSLCDNDIVKRFLSIHVADYCDSQIEEKMLKLIHPLISLGVVRLQRIVLPKHGMNPTGSSSPRSTITVGVHTTVQEAVAFSLHREGRERGVSIEVMRFLLDYFLTDDDVGPAEDTWVEDATSREALLPQVVRAVNRPTIDLEICFDVCLVAYRFALPRDLYFTAYALASRALDILLTLSQTSNHSAEDIADWKHKVAYCCFKQGRYGEAEVLYQEALENRKLVSQDPLKDIAIAKMLSELGEVYEHLGQLDTALRNLYSMHDIWHSLLQRDEKNDDYRNELVIFHERMARIEEKNKDFKSALASIQKAIDIVTPSRGLHSSKVAHLLHVQSVILMNSECYPEAIDSLKQSLDIYNTLHHFSNPHVQCPQILFDMATCYSSLDLNADRISALESALSILKLLGGSNLDGAIANYEMQANAFARLSEAFENVGNYDQSISAAEESCEIWRRLDGMRSHRTAQALCRMGKLLKTLVRYNEAEKIFDEVLTISDNCSKNEAAVEALNHMADICLSQTNYIEAEQYLNRALSRLRESQYDGEDVNSSAAIANQLCALAELKKGQNEFEKAREFYEAALRMLRTIYGSRHISVAQVLDMLADLFSEKGEERTSHRLREEALHIYRLLAGEVDLEAQEGQDEEEIKGDEGKGKVSSALGGIAALLSAEQAIDDGVSLQEKALRLLTNQYGKNYPRIALALNNLARVLRNKSRYAESQMMHEAALDILRKIHGENHPHVASALHNLGSILALQHKYSDAIVQVKAALERRRLVFGDNHILVAESLKALGHLYYAEGSFNQARSYLEECLKIRRKINENSGDDYLVATVLNNLGLVLKNMLMYTDAEELLRESLAIRMNLYGASNSQHPAIATAHYTLGILLLAIGRFHNARESLQKSLQARSISFGEVHPLIANTLNALAELAFAEGRQGEATVLMKQAVDMRTILYGSGSAVVVANLHRLISFLRMTSSDAEVAVINKRLVELGETASPANEAMIALSLLMDSFEEDDDALSPQFLKMDSSMREVNQEGVIQGGPGWVDRLLAYLARSRDSLQEDIQKRMAILHEKKGAVDVREREVGDLKCAISNKELKVKEFESLVVSDKRYIYDLQIALRDKESLVVRLSEKETKSLSDAKVEVKNLEDQFSSVHKQLEVFNGEIKTLGDLNSKQKEAMKQSSVLHDSIQSKLVSIGAIRWRLVGYDGRNEVEVTGGRNDLSALVREKGDLEIDAELHEITIRKIDKELEPYRIKYKVAEVSVAHPLPKSSVLNAEKKPIELVPATTAYAVTDVDVSSDDGNESESGDGVSGDESAGNSKRYRKKIKKQAMLIDMLTNQVISLGATPIAEVATLLKAEQKLQNALVRLMEGDEAAAKDFDKWDQFVRNHPDYKRKQIEQKLLWSSLNDPVNVAACHLMRSFVPPDIVVSCTLTSLESKLPKVIARRIWTKKALWLTRISPQKIARLHIADLQTKYSVQGLDEIELRAVYGCLPLNFENDGKGEKLAWKNSIWQSLESKCKTPLPWQATYLENSNYVPSAEELRSFILSLPRHSNYKNLPSDGPYDSSAPFQESDESPNPPDEIDLKFLSARSSIVEGDSMGQVDSKEHRPAPQRSIMRRASLFGASTRASSKSSTDIDTSKADRAKDDQSSDILSVDVTKLSGETKKTPANPPPRLSFFDEMKLQAAKKQARKKT